MVLTQTLEIEVIYMDAYKVLVKSDKLNQSYILDVSNRKEFYEGKVYDMDGKLIKPLEGFGERGGRFFLIEVGHYAQNLGLRISQENLIGVEVGGLSDDIIKKYLKLENTNAFIGLGFACGK